MRSSRTSSRPHNNFEHQSSRVFFWKLVSWKICQKTLGMSRHHVFVQHPETSPETGTLFATASHERNTSPTRNSHMRRRRTNNSPSKRRHTSCDSLGCTPNGVTICNGPRGFLEVTEFSLLGSHEKCSNGHKSTHVVFAFTTTRWRMTRRDCLPRVEVEPRGTATLIEVDSFECESVLV